MMLFPKRTTKLYQLRAARVLANMSESLKKNLALLEESIEVNL